MVNVPSVLNEAVRKNLQNLFMNMYAILKEGTPFKFNFQQVKLDKAKGVDIGETYLNRLGAVQFISIYAGQGHFEVL